jgi:hypothetical protein
VHKQFKGEAKASPFFVLTNLTGAKKSSGKLDEFWDIWFVPASMIFLWN